MDITQANYLDLYDIFVYEIVGSPILFIAIGLILIAYFCARWAIPFQASVILLLLYTAIVVIAMGYYSAWALVVLIAGLLFYWILSRVLRRG